MKVGDLVCYKGDRSSLATIIEIVNCEFLCRRESMEIVKTHWVSGPRIGRTNQFDSRDLVLVVGNNE